MSYDYSSLLRKLWHDPVWSKVISGVFLGLGALLVAYVSNRWFTEPHASTANTPQLQASTSSNQKPLPLSIESLKNLTYQIDGDYITLSDGKREFNPDTSSGKGLHEKAIAIFLTDHAFGDLDGDGVMDAVAVLQVSDGGSGIYYYLALVFNDHGTPIVSGPAYLLGDRLEFRSVIASPGSVEVQLMMHSQSDGLCCPTQYRHLKFTISNKALQCQTAPCSEV